MILLFFIDWLGAEKIRGRRDAITEEQHENTLEARDIHQSTPTSNLAVDDPDITQRIKQFYRDLTALDNVLCSECLELPQARPLML